MTNTLDDSKPQRRRKPSVRPPRAHAAAALGGIPVHRRERRGPQGIGLDSRRRRAAGAKPPV